MKNTKIFQKEILQNRNRLKKNRKLFWENNKKNFRKNVTEILKKCELPKDWKTYVVVSNFLSNKEMLPFDHDSWSIVNIAAATKKQGFETIMFINSSRVGFLSRPAIVPLVVHEVQHVRQVAKNPKKYIACIFNDKIAESFEIDAEKYTRYLSDEFRKEEVLESILYCYDLGGWKTATKMANFFNKEAKDLYSGGYDKRMENSEFSLFKQAKNKNKMDIFIDYFLLKS